MAVRASYSKSVVRNIALVLDAVLKTSRGKEAAGRGRNGERLFVMFETSIAFTQTHMSK